MDISTMQLLESEQGMQAVEAKHNSLSTTAAPYWHPLIQRLFERKISPQVVTTFQIEPYKNGWQYPTPSGALRWKNCDSNAEPKYVWLNASDAKGIYYAETIAQAIAAADGVCWMVSGEPDVWAMHSAGIPHVISGYSESTEPDKLIQSLYHWGVKRLYIAPDLDPTGDRWASKIATVLHGSGVELIARRLPPDLGDHGDLGKLWQGYIDGLPFEMYLSDLPTFFPEIKKPKQISTNFATASFPRDDWRLEVIAKLESRVGGLTWKRNGWTHDFYCIFHNDTHKPNASIHAKYGYKCWACADAVKGWNYLAQALGVKKWKLTPIPIYTPTTGLNKIGRETLIEISRDGYTALAFFLHSAYSHGWMGGKEFTRSNAKQELTDLTESSLKTAFRQMDGKGREKRAKRNRGGFAHVLSLFCLKDEANSVSNLTDPHKRGPKSKVYRLPLASDIRNCYGTTDSTFEIFPKWKIEGNQLAAFRSALQAGWIYELGVGIYPNKKVCAPLDISPSTAKRYEKKNHIERIQRYALPQELSLDDIANLPMKYQHTHAEKLVTEEELDKLEWQSEVEDGAIFNFTGLNSLKRFPATQAGARQAFASAKRGKVFLIRQLASKLIPGVSKRV